MFLNNSYNNSDIKQVYPSQNDSIPIYTNAINITFVHLIGYKNPVNISIYQELEGKYLLRQKVLCTDPYCVISNYSLTIKLLDTTFNLPNTTYSVEIEENFLRFKSEDTPIPGIELGRWMIKTTKGIVKFKLLIVIV